MYAKSLISSLEQQLNRLKANSAYKQEHLLESAQGALVKADGREMIMLASNNYLGLAAHPEVIAAAKEALDIYGNGLASVRFICGTTPMHLALEAELSRLLKTEDALLFSSCFAANEAFFASLINQLGRRTVVYSDELNHASIIDALKLVKKELLDKKVYPHNEPAALRRLLAADQNQGYDLKIIATDGVFSMEGEMAKLPELVALAKEYDCLTFVDDSHGLGVLGDYGGGSAEELKVLGEIDVISGTLGKALGGATGGFLAGRKILVEFLRQQARPYIFSNNLSPANLGAALKALEILGRQELLKKLKANTVFFRTEITKRRLKIIEGEHPIVPIMVGATEITRQFSQRLMAQGVYIIGLWFPVVPEGTARLRVQISAAHSRAELSRAIELIAQTAEELKIIN